jgi:hypothetical protein
MSMVWIQSATVTTPGSLVLSNIPQTFTHLQLRFWGRSNNNATNASVMFCLPNNDFSALYSAHALSGDGSSATAANTLSGQWGGYSTAGSTATASVFGAIVIDILDYRDTNKNRVMRSIGGYDSNGSGRVSLTSQLFRSTTAITSLGIYTEGNMAVGTRVDLYGITTTQATGA